jgi:hypothetical protein
VTDPRPSENTDDVPQWPGFRAAGFFDDLPTGDEFGMTPHDEIHELLEQADHAGVPEQAIAYAQMATALATREQTAQLTRIADALERIDITVEYPGGAS